VASRPPRARLRRIEPVLRRALAGPCAPCTGARVLVAVSGGADSTALLLGLRRIAHEFDLELVAAHLHHGLRGADADADLAHVRTLARAEGVRLLAARVDGRGVLARRGLSGQDGLRRIRRAFLVRTARRTRADLVATGHTAGDQAETLLMRVARGTGFDGLAGIAPRRGRWIRPLLEGARSDIEADLRRAGVLWREDASNRETRYLRSRIRHDALPALARSVHPDRASAWTPPVSRFTAEIRSLRGVVHRWAERRLTKVCEIREGEVRLDSRRVGTYPLALRRALFRRLWKRIAPRSSGLTRGHLEALDHVIRDTAGSSRIRLPEGIEAENDHGVLCVRRATTRGRTGAPAPTGR
jgi:tRNA(Ile)-lysidine synthase